MVHRSGLKHIAANALSRIRTETMDSTPLDDEIATFSTLVIATTEEEEESWLPTNWNLIF